MMMSMNEKKALYGFGCPNLEATIKRLRMVAAFSPDDSTKKLFVNLSVKLSEEGVERWYPCFFQTMRMEIEAMSNPVLRRKLELMKRLEVLNHAIDESRKRNHCSL